MPMFDYLRNKILNNVFSGSNFIDAPSNIYIGMLLLVPEPNQTGATVCEVTGSNYGRASITAMGGGFSTAIGGAVWNIQNITFNVPNGTWGNVVALGLFDASANGNGLFYGLLDPPTQINSATGAVTMTPGEVMAIIGCA